MAVDRYNQGWRDACDAMLIEVDAVAPPTLSVMLSAYQVRDLVKEVRIWGEVPDLPDQDPVVLSAWQRRLVQFGLRP